MITENEEASRQCRASCYEARFDEDRTVVSCILAR